MKKLYILFLMFFLTSVLSAQYRTSTIKFGNFKPGATDIGFMIGYENGRAIDRHFDIGWSVDWFHKSYIDQSLVTEFDNYNGYFNSSLNELRATTTLHSIPVLFNMTAKFKMIPRFSTYVTGGIGAEALFIFYRNYENPNEDEFDTAFDFNWRLGVGIAYQLGRFSDIVFEINYHQATPSWTYEINDPRIGSTKILERQFDMSGLMARVGFKFFY